MWCGEIMCGGKRLEGAGKNLPSGVASRSVG